MAINICPDTNLYRYITLEELVISTYGNVAFNYSTAHFDDIIANENNHCVLQAFELAKACEVVANEDRRHDIDAEINLKQLGIDASIKMQSALGKSCNFADKHRIIKIRRYRDLTDSELPPYPLSFTFRPPFSRT